MAVTFRAAGTVVTTAATSITLTSPAGTVATDVLLAGIYGNYGTGAITPPTGWTLGKRTDDTTVQNMAVYWALGNAAFTAWTIPAPTDGAIGFTLGFIGVDNTTPMDATAVGQANASSATITAPTITTANANAMLVMFGGVLSASTFTLVFGALGQSGNFSAGGNNDVAQIGAYAVQAAAGASGAKTETASLAAVNIGTLVALRPFVAAAVVRPRPIRVLLQSRASA
jgi:hypothetical protein